MKHLECIKNQITELDLSQCVALEWVDCGHNQLTTLDVSNNPALKDLYCHGNQLTALDLSQNPKLEMLGIHQNQIGSASMGALIESLPTITEGGNGTIHAISDKDEQNVITADQIAAAYAKGWTPMYFDSYWKPYDGSDPSAINSVKTIVADGTWYDLSGRRLQGVPTQKGIYVHNGRKYINK